ncbi:GTP 3',8-cyclase MoaA [Caldicellulosiruptoraceae bacterium PP1]
MLDNFGREHNYLRLSVTNQCNFNCNYCKIEQNKKNLLSLNEINNILIAFYNLGFVKLRLTGGEPFARKDIFEIIDIAYKIGYRSINITTNGSFNDEILKKVIESPIDSINISLDSIERDTFIKLTKSDKLSSVIKNIKILKEYKKVKINTVLLKDYNLFQVDKLIHFAKENDVLIRFIELMPIGMAKELFENQYVSKDDILSKYTYVKLINNGTVSDYYFLTEYATIIGIIDSVSNCFCQRCNRLRVSSEGYLYNCLFDTNYLDLNGYLHSSELLQEKIKNYIYLKNERRKSDLSENSMQMIGG